jgi:adenylyltransferase/sulfurtransferase
MITVEITDALGRYTGGTRSVPMEAETVEEALHRVFAQFPELQSRVLNPEGQVYRHLMLFVNQDEIPRDALQHPLKDGDVLEIFGAASGG